MIPYDLLEYKTPLSFSFCHVCTIFRIKEENSITNEVEYNTSVNIHSLVVQMAKGLPAMWETLVRFLGWEDPLEKEVAIHSSTLAWKTPWMEEPDRLQSMGSQRVGHD